MESEIGSPISHSKLQSITTHTHFEPQSIIQHAHTVYQMHIWYSNPLCHMCISLKNRYINLWDKRTLCCSMVKSVSFFFFFLINFEYPPSKYYSVNNNLNFSYLMESQNIKAKVIDFFQWDLSDLVGLMSSFWMLLTLALVRCFCC